MYNSIKLLFLILLTSFLFSCKNTKPKKTTAIVYKEYGLLNNQNSAIAVELKLSKVNNWKNFIKRIETIVCHDSLPKITFKTADTIKTIYLKNFCYDKYTCLFIKQKNVIEIHNDTIYKSKKPYPLDSLKSVLRKDIFNNGKDPRWSDNPNKLAIEISYDTGNSVDKLAKTLDKLTDAYEHITTKKPLKIRLVERITILPPPPKMN